MRLHFRDEKTEANRNKIILRSEVLHLHSLRNPKGCCPGNQNYLLTLSFSPSSCPPCLPFCCSMLSSPTTTFSHHPSVFSMNGHLPILQRAKQSSAHKSQRDQPQTHVHLGRKHKTVVTLRPLPPAPPASALSTRAPGASLERSAAPQDMGRDQPVPRLVTDSFAQIPSHFLSSGSF